jgi:uncharacterized protein (TIGR03086 family)
MVYGFGMSEIATRMQVLVNGFDQRVTTAAGKWDAPSPCDGWTARDVVVHVANNLRRVGAALGAAPLPEVAAEEDIAAAWAATRDGFLGALPTADWSVMVPGPGGQMPIEQMVGRFIAADTLVHTWDLARATGGDEALPPEFVAATYSGFKPMDAMLRGGGMFGPKTECPEGADLQTEFLCFLGRPV